LDERKMGTEPDSLDLVIGWDAKAKSRLTVEDIELDYGYAVTVPAAAADAPLIGRTPTLGFVDYLRLAFRWGGFPGWEGQPSPPRREIDFLGEALLPL
jgi:hypothetical protein